MTQKIHYQRLAPIATVPRGTASADLALLEATRREIAPYVTEALGAHSPAQFIEGVQLGFSRICDWLGSRHAKSSAELDALNRCFTEQGAPLRQTRLLQLASWPALDKQMLPLAPRAREYSLPSILWLFALPLTLVLPLSTKNTSLRLELSRDQQDALTAALSGSAALAGQAQIRVHNAVFSAEDLQQYGPVRVSEAARMLHETGFCDWGNSLLWWDPEIESSRGLRLFVLCTAEVPLRTASLWRGKVPSHALLVCEGVVQQALQDSGIVAEAVTADSPCAMAETLLRFTDCARQELAWCLRLAKVHYRIRTVCLRLPMDGMAELWAPSAEAPELEYLLKTPFSVVEPVGSLEQTLRELCEQEGLQFSGTYSVAGTASKVLQ